MLVFYHLCYILCSSDEYEYIHHHINTCYDNNTSYYDRNNLPLRVNHGRTRAHESTCNVRDINTARLYHEYVIPPEKDTLCSTSADDELWKSDSYVITGSTAKNERNVQMLPPTSHKDGRTDALPQQMKNDQEYNNDYQMLSIRPESNIKVNNMSSAHRKCCICTTTCCLLLALIVIGAVILCFKDIRVFDRIKHSYMAMVVLSKTLFI